MRKIVKIQPPPEQQDTDSYISLPQDSEISKPNQFNNSDHNTQPQTPNFQNIVQAKSNIQLFVTPQQFQQMITCPLILKYNKLAPLVSFYDNNIRITSSSDYLINQPF
ncbi:unnamed protein product [Paramecium octaurelia]|uniref:Uncharacterized protein n=1 Tax=Paramecium octaurelia TaxID=43137 RepID=A0A8S1VIU2_PAROT|nr:unnamed protein product [Paramecium octaurelia]